MKIKILYGLEAAGGGALKHLTYLVTRLNRQIFDVHVILSNSREENIDKEIKAMETAGASVSYLPMCRNVHLIKDLTAILKLVLIIRKESYDIVHAHSSKAGGLFRIAAWLCRVPSIYYTPHCFYFQGRKGFRKLAFQYLEKLLAKITTSIIVSESELKEISNNKVISKLKIVNINNAIDFDEYHQNREIEDIKSKLGIRNDAFVVGAIGRLVPQKDWETYIYAANEVLKTHPNTVFLIVGEGEQYREIEKLIFQLNLNDNVLLIGYVKEIHNIYGILDVFVNTSIWEGLPYVFLEAMKYKKPIITTDTGNENTISHEKSGFITPVKDYRAIASKIVALIENKQKAILMGEEGNEILTQKYSFEIFIKSHEGLYRKIRVGT